MAKAVKAVAAKTTTTKSVAEKSANNPYRANGGYWSVVESLRKLGAGKMHPASELVKAFPGVMGKDAFAAFKSKDKRNENGKDCEGRIVQNALVLLRPDYGMPLRTAGWEVRKTRGEDGYQFGLFRFNGNAANPEVVPTAKKAPGKLKASKTARKASKAK